MSIQFPDSPTQGDTFTASNDVIYTYNNGGWMANSVSGLDDTYVNRTGDTMSGDLTVPSLNGGQLAGFRNQIINGDFQIWQRGISYTYNGLNASDRFIADRWITSFDGNVGVNGTGEIYQITDVPGLTYAELITQTGSTSQVGVVQMVELVGAGIPSQFSLGTTWTISWYSTDADVGALVSWASDTTDASGTVVLPVNTGTVIETLTGNWQRRSATFTFSNGPLAGDLGLRVAIIHSSGTIDAPFQITGVQLEPGPVATPFEHRPIGTELALCQRYYYNFSNSVNGAAIYLCQYNSANRVASVQFPVTMRVKPTTVAYINTGKTIIGNNGDTKNWYVSTAEPSSSSSGYYLAEFTADAEL